MCSSARFVSAYDHITANLPDTIRTRKSNVVELVEYSGGGPRGKYKCCMLFALCQFPCFLLVDAINCCCVVVVVYCAAVLSLHCSVLLCSPSLQFTRDNRSCYLGQPTNRCIQYTPPPHSHSLLELSSCHHCIPVHCDILSYLLCFSSARSPSLLCLVSYRTLCPKSFTPRCIDT